MGAVGTGGIPGDEKVCRFQVAVHDQVGERELHWRAHLDEELQARFGAELAVVAPVVDALAVHVFEHKVAGAVAGRAGVEQMRDVRVGEPRQHSPSRTKRACTRAATAGPN